MFVASFALVLGSVGFAVPQFFSQVAHAAGTISYVYSLDTSYDFGGAYSAYYPSPGNPVSPGSITLYDGHEAGIIKAGLATNDEGLFGFKPTGTINAFTALPLTYDVVNQAGANPVWMTIEIDTGVVGNRNDNTNYQFIPTTNPTGWHTVDAAAGQWQQMDNNGNGIGSLMSLTELATANNGLNVVRAYLRLGMGDSYNNGGTGTIAWVDKATIGGVTYDFVLAAPSVTISSPALNQPINGHTVTIKGTATDSDFNYYYCYVENSHGEVGTRDASCTTTWHAVDTTGTLGTVTLPSGTPDGNYVAHLVAYDKDHNVAEVTQAFVLDNTAPATPAISYPTDNSFVANIQKVTWSAVTDNLANPVTYIYQSSTNSGTNVDGFTSPAYTSSNLSDTQISTLGTPEGTYYLHVKAVDAAGNMSAWSTTVKVTVDNTAPVAIISTPTAGKVSGHTLNIEGTATDANFNYYYCYVTNANGEVGIRDPQCVTAWSAGSLFHSAFATTITGTSNSHLGTVDLTGLSSGDAYQVHLVAYDKAGNSTEATPVSFTLDNSAPVALINAVATDTTQPTITGTLDDVYADFTVKLDGNSLDVSRKDTGWSAFVTTPLSYGTHTLVATGTDLAGNPFETTRDFTTVAPAALAPVFTPPVAVIAPAPLPQNLVAFAATPAATNDTAVLGASTTDAPVVAGAETSKKVAAAATNNDGNVFGVSWYWLLAIPAAIGAGWWATAAYRRRDV